MTNEEEKPISSRRDWSLAPKEMITILIFVITIVSSAVLLWTGLTSRVAIIERNDHIQDSTLNTKVSIRDLENMNKRGDYNQDLLRKIAKKLKINNDENSFDGP